jgi:hypothetical protein
MREVQALTTKKMNPALLKYVIFFFGFILLFYLPVAYFRLAHKNRKAQAWAAENGGVKFYVQPTAKGGCVNEKLKIRN